MAFSYGLLVSEVKYKPKLQKQSPSLKESSYLEDLAQVAISPYRRKDGRQSKSEGN